MPQSIRNRLLVTLLAAAAVIWGASGVLAYRDALHEIGELLDAHLAQSAGLLATQAGDLEEIDTEHAPLLHRYSRRVAFQVWEHGTALRLHSLNAPNTRLSPVEDGFSDVLIDHRPWRVFSVRHGDLLIQVAEEQNARLAIARSVGRNLILPLIFGLPLLGLVIAWGVHRGLRPLATLSAEVGRRAPDRLDPLPLVADTPAELRPLLSQLNTLLARLTDSFEAERRFAADAAHELRNPIAAIKAQAQVAQRAAADDERATALSKVIQACDRAARLIDQLLTLARLEPAHLNAQAADVALRALVARVMAELAPTAMSRGITLSLDGEEATIRGHGDLLALLLRNVIDNAIRYSPDRTQIQIHLVREAGSVRLVVSDQGPGIAPALRDRLGQRFQRLGRADIGGSGLGLSIARRIAELHGARLSFDHGEGGRGLAVSLMLNA